MTDYLYELKTVDARLFVMLSGALGIERGGIVTILPPAEWHDRVNAWLAEQHTATAARREGNEIVGGMLAELRTENERMRGVKEAVLRVFNDPRYQDDRWSDMDIYIQLLTALDPWYPYKRATPAGEGHAK